MRVLTQPGPVILIALTSDLDCRMDLVEGTTASEVFFESPWSKIPTDIAHEIAGHNANDINTLRSMCLVSTAMRSLAIEHLFSTINLASPDDVSQWLSMLSRTPNLNTIVKKIRLSSQANRPRTDDSWSGVPPITTPMIPSIPSVRVFEYDGELRTLDASMAMVHLPLFPNLTELRICRMSFGDSGQILSALLSTYPQIKVLAFSRVSFNQLGQDDPQEFISFALPSLETLEVTEGSGDVEDEVLVEVIKSSRPTAIKSLNCDVFRWEHRCSLVAMNNLLLFASASLTHLTLNPSFLQDDEQVLSDLPTFPALQSLTIRFTLNGSAERTLDTLRAVNLTTLIIRLAYSSSNDARNRNRFHTSLRLWSNSSQVGSILKNFPALRRVGLQLSFSRTSVVHFRRGLRRRMERQLYGVLETIGLGKGIQLLPIEWVDDRYQLVLYHQGNGKAPWKWREEEPEPETEASSEDESQGSDSEYSDLSSGSYMSE
ncbi:hypothetical protein C8F04DRAFT_1152101 [Mycena alexandri]|uniref:F-box domain-containing protein n=1 Tax=Mycena alexandri TaxID=1745969 RepID=A0AAD6S3I3_9AGAR|nr:hypothetical protein C8F04DRAFT_1152101 [Mycena alexandri]